MIDLEQKIRELLVFIRSLFVGKRSGLIKEKEDFKRENLDKLRDYIKGKERITNDEVEEILSVSDATATRYLDELEKEGLLEQVGQIGQGVYYKVK